MHSSWTHAVKELSLVEFYLSGFWAISTHCRLDHMSFSKSQMPFTYQAHFTFFQKVVATNRAAVSNSRQPCWELQGWKGKTLSPAQTAGISFKLVRFFVVWIAAWPVPFTSEFTKWIFFSEILLGDQNLNKYHKWKTLPYFSHIIITHPHSC